MARILHVVDAAGDAPEALLRLLRHLDRARWQPAVVALGSGGAALERLRALGFAVLALDPGEESGALAALQLALDARRLPRLLGGRRFDLVHARGGGDLLARLAAPRLGARAVVVSFDGAQPERDAWRRRIGLRTAGRVTRFILPAAALEPVLRARHGEAARCAVIPEGIDIAEADAALAIGRDEARRRLRLFATDIAVACVAPLDEESGAVHLLAAFHALLQEHPTARLLIVGDGPARAALEAVAASLRLGPFARFLGTLPEPWPLLAAADIFALPAFRSRMPAALLEAMAARLPAVAAATGAVQDMVAEGREALLVPSGDTGALGRALAILAADPARRREMGARARRRAEDSFRIERTAAAVAGLYGELLAGPAAAG
jgi:glycosyltransferase involved in cell wall biosynthesis